MDDIGQWLMDHPEIPKKFLFSNESLIATIKQRFLEYHENDDLLSRYLMCLALQEILLTEAAISKALIKQALQDRGINIMSKPGSC